MGIPSPGSSHDVVLLNTYGTPYGYMTSPNTSHRGVIDAFRKAIGGSDNPRYQDLSTTKIHAQTDWHKGHGNLLSEDGTFFYNRDTSVRMSNRITVGPQAVQSSASPGMANTLWINPFINATGSTQLVRVLSDGKVFVKAHGASESWILANNLGAVPLSVDIVSMGSPGIEYMRFGFAGNSHGLYTSQPGLSPYTDTSTTDSDNQWNVLGGMHRRLAFNSWESWIVSNTLASPFRWSGFYNMGSALNPITSIKSINNSLLIGKKDALWCIYNTDATPITPYKLIDFSTRPHADNFKYMIEHEGNIVVNSADGELWSINGSLDPTYNRTISAIGPFHKKALPLTMYGNITGLIKSSQYLMTSINTGASGLSGIYLNNGAGWSNWRGPGLDSGEDSSGIGRQIVSVSNIIGSPLFSQSRIYWGQDAEVYYADFVDQEENPNNIKIFNHVISNYVISPPGDGVPEIVMLWDAGLPTVVKWLDKITPFGSIRTTSGLAGSSAGVQIDYQLDPKDLNNLVWTNLSQVSQSIATRLEDTPSIFPAGTTCKRLALRLKFLTPSSSTTESPVLEALTIHYLPRPGQNKAYRYSFDIWRPSDQNLLSGQETTTMIERADNLFTIHAAQVPVTMYRSTGAASPLNVTGHRVVISDIDEAEAIPNKRVSSTHPRGLRTNVTFIEV